MWSLPQKPKIPIPPSGTVFSAAEEVVAAGGRALPLIVDIRFEEQVAEAIEKTVKEFGGIDILVNNASAIALAGSLETPMKKFDLMQQVNARGTFLCSKLSLPHLLKSKNPHILTLAPPLNFNERWFKDHLPYTLSKYGMSLCVMGLAAEFKDKKIAVNALWPKYLVATAATYMLAQSYPGIEMKNLRNPEIVADAAYEILNRPSEQCSGNFFLDEELLKSVGITDFSKYMNDPSGTPILDIFLN